MPKKILLVDDEELVIKSVSKLLNKQGYEVLTCDAGEDAINAIRKENFDLIVCDIRMPRMTGTETIKQIRKELKAKNKTSVPEILITGYADDETNKEAEALKVADYIYKPFDLADFLNCVNKHLKK